MTRAEAEALLPFLVNGTLDGAERAEVERLLSEDPGLRADHAALMAVRDTLQAEDAGHSPGEIGLARLMRGVDADGTAAPLASGRMPAVRLWQIAATVLLAVALAQGAFLIRSTGDGPGYELAGTRAAPLVAAVRPETTEAALRAALLDAGAEIVSGPSALGLYGLAPVNDTVTLETLRAALLASELFESVDVSAD